MILILSCLLSGCLLIEDSRAIQCMISWHCVWEIQYLLLSMTKGRIEWLRLTLGRWVPKGTLWPKDPRKTSHKFLKTSIYFHIGSPITKPCLEHGPNCTVEPNIGTTTFATRFKPSSLQKSRAILREGESGSDEESAMGDRMLRNQHQS